MDKVGVDFDGTLYDRLDVRSFVKELLLYPVDVWIVTTRLESKDNSDIYELADELGIKNIHFTNMEWKFEFYKDKDFIFHIDDDSKEIELLESTNTVGLHINSDFRLKGFELI